jgi:very-short-patch-repair endonuclease
MISDASKSTRAAKAPLRANARRMRHEPTDAERKFWSRARGRAFAGYKFKRQYPIGCYIVDFVCLEHRLIVELDGGQHARQEGYDEERTAFLQARGFRVMRFWNDEFLKHPDETMEGVLLALETGTNPSNR